MRRLAGRPVQDQPLPSDGTVIYQIMALGMHVVLYGPCFFTFRMDAQVTHLSETFTTVNQS